MRQGTISIIIADRAWSKVPRLHALARAAARQALDHASASEPCEVAIRFASDAEVAELNKRWRGKNRATNVLSFPTPIQSRPTGQLGDIVLAFGVVAAEARDQGKSVEAHTAHLIVHGVLHLLGFDHRAKNEANQMEKAEIAILARMGYDNPYILV